MPRGGKWGIFYKSLWLKHFGVWEEPSSFGVQNPKAWKNEQGTFDESGACSGDQVILMSCIGGCTKQNLQGTYPIWHSCSPVDAAGGVLLYFNCFGRLYWSFFCFFGSYCSYLFLPSYYYYYHYYCPLFLAFAVFSWWFFLVSLSLWRPAQAERNLSKKMHGFKLQDAAGPWRDTMWGWGPGWMIYTPVKIAGWKMDPLK